MVEIDEKTLRWLRILKLHAEYAGMPFENLLAVLMHFGFIKIHDNRVVFDQRFVKYFLEHGVKEREDGTLVLDIQPAHFLWEVEEDYGIGDHTKKILAPLAYALYAKALIEGEEDVPIPENDIKAAAYGAWKLRYLLKTEIYPKVLRKKYNRRLVDVDSDKLIEIFFAKHLDAAREIVQSYERYVAATRKSEEKPPEKQPAPTLLKAVEEIEIPAGLPALAYKVRNMAYVLTNLFQHLEDETRIHVDGIRAMYDMVERKAALLELFNNVLGVWERDVRKDREPTPINMILFGRLKNVLLRHPGIKGDLVKAVENAGKLGDLLDERVINYLVDAYKALGVGLSPAEIRELHGLLDGLHSMEMSRIWSGIDANAEFSEKAMVLEYWRRYLARLGITPRASGPEETEGILKRVIEAAVDSMEQRLGIMKGWGIAGKLREVYDKLFAEAERVIEASKNIRSFGELAVRLNQLREIDMVHGSRVANQLFTAAVDGALRKISEEARNIFLLSKYSREASESYAGSILSAAETLGFTRTTLIPPLVAEIEEMRRELATKKTVFENVRRRINALDSMVKSAYSRIKGLLEATVELGPYYPRELVKETLEQTYREMQGLTPREKIHVKG